MTQPRAMQASDALPLPIRHTNWFFSALFFVACYYLMLRWREKIRSSTPLHLLSFSEISAVVALVASFTYLVNFFGIGIIQSFLPRPSDDLDLDLDLVDTMPLPIPKSSSEKEDDLPPVCSLPPTVPKPTPRIESVVSMDDDEIANSVVLGLIPSYSLESRLGDCRRAAGIRKEAVRRMTGRELKGLSLDGFDYESILGQCCEMPIGYVSLPVGIAGPLVLDGAVYYVPMATTEGCLVASTNRGCKAIRDSGGAQSVILKDGMTRAPAVRFDSARRAADLKFYLEDSTRFEEISLVFNRFVFLR